MPTDSQLQHDVLAEIEWDPGVDHTHIGVAVSDGIVTLSGFAESRKTSRCAFLLTRRRMTPRSPNVSWISSTGTPRSRKVG